MDTEWHHDPDARWQFNVDIVGGCNLRCPSCPVGNAPEVRQPKGTMKPELLDRIVRKAAEDTGGKVDFALYNWTEPFLHPQLAQMIEVVNGHGFTAGISSNLNRIRNIDDVMRANPRYLKVSVSGFSEDGGYATTHRGGEIARVKENMRLVSEAKYRTGATTRLSVPFHRYLGNHEDEFRMREFAEPLGFEFDPAWAFLMPLEKVLAFAEPDATDVRLTDEDRALIDRLALPLEETLDVVRDADVRRCKLRDQQMAINCEGDVMLCCSTYDPDKYRIGSYLEASLPELQARKFAHDQCTSCMRNGVHVLFTYSSAELDPLAMSNVARHYPDAGLPSMADLRSQRPHGLRAWPRKLRKQARKLGAAVRRSRSRS